MTKWDFPQDYKLIQYSKINHGHSPYQQPEKEKPLDPIIWCRIKKYEKLKHQFKIKTLSKLGIDENFVNWIKSIYIFSPPKIASIIVNGDKDFP